MKEMEFMDSESNERFQFLVLSSIIEPACTEPFSADELATVAAA
jgi:hypothetical protein